MVLTAHIGLSYICNMNCIHCFVSKENDINFDYKEILDKLYDEGVMVLYYTYGEPLLWNDFYDMAKYASVRRFSQILMTNGSMIVDEHDANKIKEAGIKRTYISLDSIDSKKHDNNRNYIGAYDKAINAIKILKQSDLKVGISCAVNNNNVRELYEIYRLGIELKVDYISFLRTRINRGLCCIDESIYKEELLKILKLKYPIKIQLHDFSLNKFLKEVYEDKIIDYDEYNAFLESNKCNSHTNISIAPSGDVVQCNLNPICIGNIMKEDLSQILSKRKDCICKITY